MLVLIDNYDSFTYNLYQVMAQLDCEIEVVRNDAIDIAGLEALKPSHLMISPGPGNPDSAGISMAALSHFAGRIPILGVCLGHQCLAQVYGAAVVRAERIMHGKTSPIQHEGKNLVQDVPQGFEATRYHSLVVARESLSEDFSITAWTDEDEVMGLRHEPTGAQGVQFHPESILSVEGPKLIEAFVRC